ncbi:hypothetical protein C8R43DRAFT_549569 [Mycena crocata]|nr:hypothetical protein C8R43DRAFT_549569 [Mycena crocata]
MDSDVEMVDPPTLRPASPPTPHVSPAPSTPHSVLDDLQHYGSPEKQPDVPDVPDADQDEEHEPDVADNDEHDNADNADDPLPPPTTNEDDPDAPMSPLGPDGEEPDDDASESENSSDDASEDDVDKDLIPTAADISDVDPDVIVVDGAPDAIRIPVLVQTPPLDTAAPTSPLSAPPTSAAKPPPPAPTQKKPKSHHAPPPPPPPPPPAPMQTIRLEIRLGGPENYEIDVKGKARDEGFVWGEPVGKKYADEESSDEGSDGEEGEGKEGKDDGKDKDGDVEMDADGKPKKPKPKPKKKSKSKSKAAAEYYDTTDPFIDDSELAIDERTYFAQTKQKGFYVSSGEVALVRDKSPKKPKSKKKVGPSLALTMPTASTSALKPASTAVKKTKSAGTTSKAPTSKAPTSKAATAAAAKALGTKESPIPLEDEDEDKADVFGGPPRRASTSAAGGKGKGKERAGGDGDDDAEVNGNGMSSTRSPNGVGVNGNGVNGDHPSGNGKEEMSGDGEDGEGGGEDEVGKKRKRAGAGAGTNGVGGGEGVKKRKVVDIESFHPDLQTSIEKMKQAIAAESWETKSKFPPNLKPLLAALSLQAITLDQYDDQFFNLMPLIFPYNKFTMSKLIKRTIFHDHTALLNQRQDDLLEQLKVLAQEGFPKAQEEWERSLQNYEEKRKEKAARADGDPAAGESGVEGSTAPTRHGTEDPEARLGSAGLSSAGDGEKDKSKGDNDKEGPGKGGAHHGPPLKKYRMGESMKVIVWQLVLLSNEICRLENEKNSLEGSVLQVSEQGLRKVLYQRIVSAFPEGWMSSGQISRDVSAMKKKYEKEAQDD